MIPRYSRPEMARLWSDENRFATWLEVEIAASEVLVERGVVPREALAAIKANNSGVLGEDNLDLAVGVKGSGRTVIKRDAAQFADIGGVRAAGIGKIEATDDRGRQCSAGP